MDAQNGNVSSTKANSKLDMVVLPKTKQVNPLLSVEGESLPVGECLKKFQVNELEDEIQDLIDDQVYNEFVVSIAKEKPIDQEHLNDDGDQDFIPKTVCSVTINEANCDEAKYPTKSWEELSSSSESETSTVIGETDAVTAHLNQDPEVSPDELDLLQNNVPVAVPKKSLKKKQERYPPFWRVKHAIRNVGDNDGYKSEEDPDFLPENEDVNGSKNISSEKEKLSDMRDQNDSSAMSYQSDEENYDCEELEQEVKCLQEMPDLKQDVKGISEMVQEMCFVSNSINDQCTGQNTLNDMEEGNDDDVGFSAINVDAIIQFNNADYDEEGDPDYEPQIVDGRNTD